MAAFVHTVSVSLVVYLINITKCPNHQDLPICTLNANARCWYLEIGFQCVRQRKWSYIHWCQVCTLHKTCLLTVGWQLICLVMCTAQVFKISYPIHLVSLSIPTYSVTIKNKANYILKYNFIATETAKTSLLKHFILFHDIAQKNTFVRHIISLFSSKNKHLETGNQDTLLVPHCGNIPYPLCLLLSRFSPYSKHHAKKKYKVFHDLWTLLQEVIS